MAKEAALAALCVVFCISIFQLGLIIPSLYFGYLDEDSTCQKGARGGLDLSDWIKGFGFEKVALNAVMYISIPLVAFVHEYCLIFPAVSLFCDFFFNIIWWIWGVVILATPENNHCVADGKGMAVMAIVDLALGGLWFIHLRLVSQYKESAEH